MTSASAPQVQPGTDETRPSIIAMVGAAVAVVIVLLLGIFVLGRLASSAVVAMVLTSIFFGLVFAVLAFIVWRRRAWLLPLAVPFVVIVLGAGALLGAPLVFDDVVDEEVVTASSPVNVEPTGPSAKNKPAPSNVAVSRGSFEPLAHPGRGTATLIRTSSNDAKVTLTDFATDNGPDVRVYLSRGTGAGGTSESFVDLGGLKGNKGNQQYDVPAGLDLTEFDAVVLWCRAFDVGFTQALLTGA